MRLYAFIFFLFVCAMVGIVSTEATADQFSRASAYNVVWQLLGKDYNDSMPVGNGDISLNVWTEPNGDLVFLIGKADAWTENGQLVKLGRVRIGLTPNPFSTGASLTQTLDVASGEIDIAGGTPTSTMRVWVDANRPVIHIEGAAASPVAIRASVELWRSVARTAVKEDGSMFREITGGTIPIVVDPDTVLPAQSNQIAWCHFNSRSTYPMVFQNQHLESLLAKYPDPLLHRTFGAIVSGDGLVADGNQALVSANPMRTFRVDLCAVTQTADSPEKWRDVAEVAAKTAEAIPIESARTAHRKWWSDFWNRSWIDVSGTPQAAKVAQGYAMQRWMNACAGRGAMPIKFNGSILTVGQETVLGDTTTAIGMHNPDYRSWGGCFWAQNERHIFWPMIAAGDYDLLDPYLRMYRNDLPLEIDRTHLYFNHAGASYPETMYFWGTPCNQDFGWGNPTDIMRNPFIKNHITGGLETVAMMLGEYDNTQDESFARNTLLPVADAVVTYFDRHWPRGTDGKISMDPSQAIETYRPAPNPTPDIAGLMDILPRLLTLPQSLTTEAQRTTWRKELADLPPLPMGKMGPDGKLPDVGKEDPNGKPIVLPALTYGPKGNNENPELYTVFPFRLYGIGLPNLELALNTYAARRFRASTCWGQDGEEAALLGLTSQAKSCVSSNFSDFGNGRFGWFWRPGHDWIPDMDNGGAGMTVLQFMLMQCDGKRIQLLPAWPADWDADFKLHAPYNTTVEGKVRGGKLTDLTVTPASRRNDVVVVAQQVTTAPLK